MKTSEQIRSLAREGLSTADIALKLGIQYQHAYQVLRKAGLWVPKARNIATCAHTKPQLTVSVLLKAGFRKSGEWVRAQGGGIETTEKLSKAPGVYAFAIDETVQYVGLATMGLAKRIYYYSRPGVSQKTSVRLNKLFDKAIQEGIEIRILIAEPGDFDWNGLPVLGSAGLELGLIKAFDLPWNQRSN